MVKSAQNFGRDDASTAFNRSTIWQIFLQTEMGPRRVIVWRVCAQDASKMRLVAHDHVVEAVAPDRADDALGVAVLPR